MRQKRILRPGLLPSLGVAAPSVLAAWCLLPNHEVACVAVALVMPILVPWMMSHPGQTGRPDWTMGCMVGGTAGGMLGGILVRIFCDPGAMMPIMMASMAGMVGGTLCGWGAPRG